jgi:hypothetical protein
MIRAAASITRQKIVAIGRSGFLAACIRGRLER